jgi:hypothetical protein
MSVTVQSGKTITVDSGKGTVTITYGGPRGAKGDTGANGSLAWQDDWASDHGTYYANDFVYHAVTGYGKGLFRCIAEHDPSVAATEPVVGGSAATYWETSVQGGKDGEGGDMESDGSVVMTGALTMTQIATPSEPASGKTAVYPKSDGGIYRYSNGGIEEEIGAVWRRLYGCFTATPASTSTLTMTVDKTATIKVGMGLKYKISSTYYYGIVTAITSNLLTIAGAPLSGDVSELYWCPPERVIQVDFFIPGMFADAANTALLNSDVNTAFEWNLGKAYCVLIRHKVKTDDSGAAQPHVTISIAGSVVGTDNTNAGQAVAETWTSTVVGINTSNYDINQDDAIEVVTDANGTNDDASDLTVSAVFVLE